MGENSSKTFELLRKTLQTIISEIESSETIDEKLERLCHVAGVIKPEIVSTAIQLMETGKVRYLIVSKNSTINGKRSRRKFENFTERPVFDVADELKTWSRSQWKTPRKREKVDKNQCFVEVENAKKRELLHFMYPSVHFCTCQYFQVAVLEQQNDWICVHLLSFYIAQSFDNIEHVECNPTIADIVRKILTRSIVPVPDER